MKSILFSLSLLAQDGGTYPPKPGEQPNYPILVGPAADRYRELLAKEKKLDIARAQLTVILAELDIEIYKQQEGSTVARLKQLQDALAAKLKSYNIYVDEAIKDSGKEGVPGCAVDLQQGVSCPEGKK